jgi:hypothetical protein
MLIKQKKLFYLFTLFLLVPACSKIKFSDPNLRRAKTTQERETFQLGINGIECKTCAKVALKRLEEISGIRKAEFICLNKNFDGFTKIYWQNFNSNLNMNQINKKLEEEGFKLTYITGHFIGEFIKKEDKYYFKFFDSENYFQLTELLNQNKNKLYSKKKILINGTLKLDPNTNQFRLISFIVTN